MSGFSRNFAVTITPSAHPNFLNKGKTPFECKCQIGSVTFQFFVNVGENLIMMNDVTMPSNPPVAPIEKERLEDAPHDETPLDINVFQQLREEKSSRKMVRTQVDHLT
jgi:hypothetical protein